MMLSSKTPVRMPLSAFFAGILSIATVIGTAYGFHDRGVAQINQSIMSAILSEREARTGAIGAERAARLEAFKHYLEKEEFMKVWYRESAKRDFQYSELLMMMERLKNEVRRQR